MILIIGTTPTFTLNVLHCSDLDLRDASNIYFTIRQGSKKIIKSGEDIAIVDNDTIQVTLSQSETLMFRYLLKAEIQVNWIYPNGARAATYVKRIPVFKNLIREPISDSGPSPTPSPSPSPEPGCHCKITGNYNTVEERLTLELQQ